MEDRYRSLQDQLRLPVGAPEALVYSPLHRRATMVDQADLALLNRCGEFATLHEHASRLAGPMVSATTNVASSVRQLASLVERGLLVSERVLVEQLRAASTKEPRDESPPRISMVGMPTAGRTALARDAVKSMCRSFSGGRPLELVVAHDARDADDEADLVDALRGVASGGIALRYLGVSERERYASSLAKRADVDPILVRWALSRPHPDIWACGAVRNALLLEGVGRMSLQVDDDIEWAVGAPPIHEPGLALTSSGSVMEHWFPAPGKDGDTLIELVAGDVTEAHERLLGRDAKACLAEAESIDLCDASGRFLRDLMAGEGRVRATQMGLAGDSATGSLGHYLMLAGKSRERLVVSKAIYDHAFASRHGVRGPRRQALSDATFCMSYALGLDGREVLPPFTPFGRNADGVFGMLLRHAFSHHLVGYVPEVVAHRAPPRAYSMDHLLGQLAGIDANDLLCRMLASTPRHRSLARLGSDLVRLGRLPLADLEEEMRMLVLRTRSRDLSSLRHTLARHHRRPSFWARDVDAFIARLGDVVLERDHALPRDLMAVFGRDPGRRALAHMFLRFGQLLEVWPALDTAARELAAEGVRPSRPWP